MELDEDSGRALRQLAYKLFINTTEADITDTNTVTVAASLSSSDQRSQSPLTLFSSRHSAVSSSMPDPPADCSPAPEFAARCGTKRRQISWRYAPSEIASTSRRLRPMSLRSRSVMRRSAATSARFGANQRCGAAAWTEMGRERVLDRSRVVKTAYPGGPGI